MVYLNELAQYDQNFDSKTKNIEKSYLRFIYESVDDRRLSQVMYQKLTESRVPWING